MDLRLLRCFHGYASIVLAAPGDLLQTVHLVEDGSEHFPGGIAFGETLLKAPGKTANDHEDNYASKSQSHLLP